MFWDRVLPLLKEKNISQIQLSRKIGKGDTQVNRWVERSTIPPVDFALKIAQVLGVEIESLFPELFPNKVSPSPIRQAFQEFIDTSTDDELQKMWDFFELMRGKK